MVSRVISSSTPRQVAALLVLCVVPRLAERREAHALRGDDGQGEVVFLAEGGGVLGHVGRRQLRAVVQGRPELGDGDRPAGAGPVREVVAGADAGGREQRGLRRPLGRGEAVAPRAATRCAVGRGRRRR